MQEFEDKAYQRMHSNISNKIYVAGIKPERLQLLMSNRKTDLNDLPTKLRTLGPGQQWSDEEN